MITGIKQNAAAFAAAAITAFTLSSVFYTQQVLADQFAIGAHYTTSQQMQTYWQNFLGLAPAFGAGVAGALLIGFFVASQVKKILTPLAPIAYPVAGAAALVSLIWIIEITSGRGGFGAISGAQDAIGLSLQGLAGFIGGAVFFIMRPKQR